MSPLGHVKHTRETERVLTVSEWKCGAKVLQIFERSLHEVPFPWSCSLWCMPSEISTYSRDQTTSTETDISTRACVGQGWIPRQTSTRSICWPKILTSQLSWKNMKLHSELVCESGERMHGCCPSLHCEPLFCQYVCDLVLRVMVFD